VARPSARGSCAHVTKRFEVVRDLDATSTDDAHLVVRGAEVTLCNQPATELRAVGARTRADANVPICWLCRATSQE